jgi:hypothetical protein
MRYATLPYSDGPAFAKVLDYVSATVAARISRPAKRDVQLLDGDAAGLFALLAHLANVVP